MLLAMVLFLGLVPVCRGFLFEALVLKVKETNALVG
jgi:hypothetical protein